MKTDEMKPTDPQANGDQAPAKAPYQRPVLVNLGSLRDMTTKITGGGSADGGKKQFTGRGGLDGLGSRARD